MTRRRPGLPEDFALEVAAGDVEDRPPANIGDFLDEDDAIIRAKPDTPTSRRSKARRVEKVVGKIEPKSTPYTTG